MLALAIRAVLAEVQPEPILRALNAAITRLYAEAVEAVEGFPPGASVEEIMRGAPSGVRAFQRLDKAAAGYGRCRQIYLAFVAVGGFDPTFVSGRPGVFSEIKDPLKLEKRVTPEGDRVRHPAHEPSVIWPDESEFGPAERTAATRKRLEIFARAVVAPWMPSPTELAGALVSAGVESPKPTALRSIGGGVESR